jgi:hypothetical protein
METIVRDEILKTLDRMPHDRLRRALDLIRAMDAETPHGTRGRDLLDLAGTLCGLLDGLFQKTISGLQPLPCSMV